MDVILEQLPIFLLVLIRLTTFFILAPIFSLRSVPNRFKIGLAFFLSVLALPMVQMNTGVAFQPTYILLIFKEMFIGLLLGFIAAFLIYIVQIAGAFIDFQMGFAIANILDPQTGYQMPIISNFKYMLTLLFFVTVDGHHMLLRGILQSYQWIPIDSPTLSAGTESIAFFLTTLFARMFLIAVQIALPIVGSLFLVDVALGIIARTVPQVNVFIVGMPLKIFAGFILLLITIPIYFYVLNDLIQQILENLYQMIYQLGV